MHNRAHTLKLKEVCRITVRTAIRQIKFWSHLAHLNRRPVDYESTALPTELRRLEFDFKCEHRQRKDSVFVAVDRSSLRYTSLINSARRLFGTWVTTNREERVKRKDRPATWAAFS